MNEINLYNGDCLEIMDKLIADRVKVDAIITDPPFLHVKGGMKSKRINTGSYKAESFVNTKMRDFDENKIYEFLDLSKKYLMEVLMDTFFVLSCK